MSFKIELVSEPKHMPENIGYLLNYLDKTIFPDDEIVDKSGAYWWLCYDIETDKPIGFAGLQVVSKEKRGFLCRCGILPEYRGNGLQKRMIKARERKAKSLKLNKITTYVRLDNIASANSLISCGYKLFIPENELYSSDWISFFKNIK